MGIVKKTYDTIEYFFKDNRARLSDETIRCYRIALNQFFKFCRKDLDEIKRVDIRGWHNEMDKRGLQPKSIHLKLVALRSFYQYCMEEYFIKKNPTLNMEMPKLDDSLPDYLEKKELALLLELVKDNKRERAIVETLYATGVRISELLNIRLADIKWDTRQIWIRKGKGNKERFVLFTAECEVRLKDYLLDLDSDSPYLFPNESRGGKPYSRDWVELRFREYSKKLKFKVTPHKMRHTFGAHLAEKEMPLSYIKELFGHVNINTTRLYTRLNDKARKRQYDSYQ